MISSRRVFLAALAVLAVHAIVDELVSVEPGSSRADHLLATAAVLAVCALSAAAFHRLRPGAAAALAGSLGLLAAFAGAVAAGELVAEGVDADVITGLALLPAAAALIAVAATLAWSSRKPGGRPLLRRALIAVASLVFVFEVIFPVGIAIVATHRPGSSESADLGTGFRDVAVATADGLRLRASFVPSRNGAAVITYPEREGAAEHARMLAANGFGVLALDARGYGSSDGDPNAFGWGGTADIDAAVEFLRGQPGIDPARIGGFGLSVGGEQMIEAAAANEGLRAVVSEGAGERSVRETLLHGIGAAPVIPQRLILTAATAVLSAEKPPPALDDAVSRISPRAVFLIHAEHGEGGEELNPEYFERAGEPKQIWEVEGAGHTGGFDEAPEEYERRVVEFFEANLPEHATR